MERVHRLVQSPRVQRERGPPGVRHRHRRPHGPRRHRVLSDDRPRLRSVLPVARSLASAGRRAALPPGRHRRGVRARLVGHAPVRARQRWAQRPGCAARRRPARRFHSRRGPRSPERSPAPSPLAAAAPPGSEGPVVVLGAAIGSLLGRAFRFTPQRTATFVGCASAAAISAAFNAPLAGAFFAIEEILGSFSVASFSPVVVASVVAAVVSRAVFGNHPAFPIPAAYGYGSIGRGPDLLPASRRRHRLYVDRLRANVFRNRCARGPIPPPARHAVDALDRRGTRRRHGMALARVPGRIRTPRPARRDVRAVGVVCAVRAGGRKDRRDRDHAGRRRIGWRLHTHPSMSVRRHRWRPRRAADAPLAAGRHSPRGLRGCGNGGAGRGRDRCADHRASCSSSR